MPAENKQMSKGTTPKKVKKEDKAEQEESNEVVKPSKVPQKNAKEGKSKKIVESSDSDSSDSSSSEESDTEKNTKQQKGKDKDVGKKKKVENKQEVKAESKKDKVKESNDTKAKKVEEKGKEEKKEKKAEKKTEGKQEGKSTPVENKKRKMDDDDTDSSAKKAKGGETKKTGNATIDVWREAQRLTIQGDNCPAPFITFEEAKFPEYIAGALEKLNFKNPTPIQSQTWPLAISRRDMVGLAETGSGKTLAFILPAVMHISNKTKAERAKGPSVLVLAPTRELAQQIESVTASMCKAANIKSCCVYGGVPKDAQLKAIKGAEVIIATPGRLIDFMSDETTHVSNVTYLVLDEADRMLDMGFEMQINQIMRDIVPSPQRQTLMFSATWPKDVQRLSQKFFTNPVKLTIGSEKLSGAKKVTQIIEVVEQRDRKRRLKQLLNQVFKDKCRILIFMLYKNSCSEMANELQREGWPVGCINGNMSQTARDKTLADFKSGVAPIMVATDVAARGLDIKEVKYVINVEFPLRCEDYVHRIGRTGRAGEAGTAYTYFSADDKQHARELVKIMRESGQNVSEELAAIAEKAPGIKPKKTAMQEMYGDFAKGKGDVDMTAKPKRIVFD